MSRISAIGRFLYDFIVGDDWRVAAGVVLTGAVTALLATTGIPAWWLAPLAVVGLLYLSVRPARNARAGPSRPRARGLHKGGASAFSQRESSRGPEKLDRAGYS